METTFYERLKELRKAAGLTQGQLSEKMLVHLQTVSRWERGLIEPDISQLGELSVTLNVSLEKLLGVTEGEKTFQGNFDAAVFGKTLSKLRAKQGESQEVLATFLNVSPDAVSRWERGVTCPAIRELIMISDRYGVTVSELYYGIDETVEVVEPVVYAKAKRKPFVISTIVASALSLVLIVALILVLTLNVGAGGNGQTANTFAVTVGEETYTAYEDQAFMLPAPEKQGYDFIGWTDEDGNAVSFPLTITEDKNFYPKFQPSVYSVNYFLNGGLSKEDLQNSITIDDEIYLPNLEKVGAEFLGWYLTPDYSGDKVEKISCELKNVTLYAKWSDKTYTIIYDLNGGMLDSVNPETVTSDETFTLNAPYKKGYSFLGWYDEAIGGEVYATVGGETAKNLVLYARYQKEDQTFSINYHLNGGVLEDKNPASVKRGEVVKLSAPLKRGHVFLGWCDDIGGEGNYYEKLVDLKQNLDLYAVYQAKTYTIRYEYDGVYETEKVNPNKIVFGETVTLLPVYQRGYAFKGWYISVDYKSDELITVIDETNVDLFSVLYAKFDIINYSVLLDLNGGTLDNSNNNFVTTPTIKDGKCEFLLTIKSPTFTLPDPIKEDYVFQGWFFGEKKVETIDALTLSDMELKAKWIAKKSNYKLTYVLNDDLAVNDNPSEFSCTEKLVLSDPVLTGYYFLGWYDNADGFGDRVTKIPAGNEKDVTLYAVWQKIAVIGSSEFFEYVKTDTSVCITQYTGEYGENVTLNIPAKIDGLPVTEIGGLMAFGTTFNSIVIPEGVSKLGDLAFSEVSVVNPIVIPSSVIELGRHCFRSAFCQIVFAENSRLETIHKEAFYSCYLDNVLVIPQSVTYVYEDAFLGSFPVVFNGRVDYLDYRATGGIFLTDGAVAALKTIDFTDGPIYTSQNASGKLQALGCTPKIASKITVKFVDTITGETVSTKTDYAFVLPEMQKSGYRFLGWSKDSVGDGNVLTSKLFVSETQEDVTLYAKFIKLSSTDGFTEDTAKVLPKDCTYERLLSLHSVSPKEFYFVIDTEVPIHVIISVNVTDYRCEAKSNDDWLVVTDKRYRYEPGTVLTIRCYGGIVFATPLYTNCTINVKFLS